MESEFSALAPALCLVVMDRVGVGSAGQVVWMVVLARAYPWAVTLPKGGRGEATRHWASGACCCLLLVVVVGCCCFLLLLTTGSSPGSKAQALRTRPPRSHFLSESLRGRHQGL